MLKLTKLQLGQKRLFLSGRTVSFIPVKTILGNSVSWENAEKHLLDYQEKQKMISDMEMQDLLHT